MTRPLPSQAEGAEPCPALETDRVRREFDESFARDARIADSVSSMLAVEIGGHGYALELGEIAGVERCCSLTPLPFAVKGLSGLGSSQGVLVAVFDLTALDDRGAAPCARPWIIVLRADRQVAIGVDVVHGQVPVSNESSLRTTGREDACAWIRRAVRAGDSVLRVVDLQAVLETVRPAAAPIGGAP